MIRTIDYSALTGPVAAADVTAFKAAAKLRPNYTGTSPVGQIIAVVVVTFMLGIFLLSFLGVGASFIVSIGDGSPAVTLVVVIFVAIFLGVAGLIVWAIIRSITGGGGRWERWLRLDRFATANGLVFSPVDANPQYPGAIFSSGSSRAAIDHLRSASERFLDYGNYRYVTSNGKSSTTHNWGFMALQLDRSLPHMVLDSKANNGLFGGSNLPATFSKDQVLSLEGNFNEFFTLYCPKQYERDALYVFTPDLMALLIDNVAPYDVEIVDRWMFVYSGMAFDLRQPAVHQRLLSIVDTVGAKTLTQTDRYQDERITTFAENVVAPQGKRLRRGFSVGAIIFLVALVLVFVGPLFLSVFAAFFGLISGN